MEMKFAEWLNQKFLEEALANKTRPNVSKLARRLGTSQSVVTRWLNGDVEPSSEYLREIAKLYGMEAYDILNRERPKTLVRALYFSPKDPISEEEQSKIFAKAKAMVRHIQDPVEREQTFINYLESQGIEHFSTHIEDKYDPDELDQIIDQLSDSELEELHLLIKQRQQQKRGKNINETGTTKGANPSPAEA